MSAINHRAKQESEEIYVLVTVWYLIRQFLTVSKRLMIICTEIETNERKKKRKNIFCLIGNLLRMKRKRAMEFNFDDEEIARIN